jgi:hypothetical protein
LVIKVDGMERRFEGNRVRRVQKRGDSLRNGAVIGAIVGAAIGLLGSLIADCPGDDPGGPCPVARVGLFAASTAVYSAAGIGIDALIAGRTTLYESGPLVRFRWHF